jgi:hypothetical protein
LIDKSYAISSQGRSKRTQGTFCPLWYWTKITFF